MAQQKVVVAVECRGRPEWDADALRRLRQVVDIALAGRAQPEKAPAATTDRHEGERVERLGREVRPADEARAERKVVAAACPTGARPMEPLPSGGGHA